MAGTILIVEDDRAFRATVVRYLRRLQFTILEAGDGEQALKFLETHPVELVILDIGVGKQAALEGKAAGGDSRKYSGFALLEIVRARPGYISIIVLTALDEPVYEIASLRYGADDFLLKKPDLEALGARVNCCLRRGRLLSAALSAQSCQLGTLSPGVPDIAGSALRAGDFCIDLHQRLLRIGDGPYVDVTESEARLLHLMAGAPDKVFRKHELLEGLWGKNASQTYHSVDAVVKSVRRKIEPAGGKPHYLLNSYGVGYRLNLVAKRTE